MFENVTREWQFKLSSLNLLTLHSTLLYVYMDREWGGHWHCRLTVYMWDVCIAKTHENATGFILSHNLIHYLCSVHTKVHRTQPGQTHFHRWLLGSCRLSGRGPPPPFWHQPWRLRGWLRLRGRPSCLPVLVEKAYVWLLVAWHSTRSRLQLHVVQGSCLAYSHWSIATVVELSLAEMSGLCLSVVGGKRSCHSFQDFTNQTCFSKSSKFSLPSDKCLFKRLIKYTLPALRLRRVPYSSNNQNKNACNRWNDFG